MSGICIPHRLQHKFNKFDKHLQNSNPLKTHQMFFSGHPTLEKSENAKFGIHFRYAFEGSLGREITWSWSWLSYSIALFAKRVLVHPYNAKPAFSNSSGLTNVFEKLLF